LRKPLAGACLLSLLLLGGCAGPIVEFESTPEHTRRAIRPIVFYERTLSPDPTNKTGQAVQIRASFLWPLGSYRSDPERSRFRFLPFHFQQTRRHPEGPDRNAITGMLFFHGTHPTEGRYAALFPAGGTLKNLFFKDRIDFFAFPSYAQVRTQHYRSHNLLWPIFNRTEGAVRGWKVWPLAGRYRKAKEDGTPLYDRRFYLWPLVTDHRNALDTDAPSRLFLLFPVYGSRQGRSLSERTWLFPLFKHRVEMEKGTRIREDWRVPFPFVQLGSGADYLRRDFWPVYGRHRIGAIDRTFVLWPIFRKEHREEEGRRDRKFFALPIHWHGRRWDAQGHLVASHDKWWPLYASRLKEDGSRKMEWLSPLWFEDRFGLDELLGPFWRLYASETSPQGERKRSILFGILRQRKTPDGKSDWSLLGMPIKEEG
jgi:hypothetical protein